VGGFFMSYYVYILSSIDTGRFYIGQTKDIDQRLLQHNSGLVKSSKPYRPYIIYYVHEVQTRSEALKLEKSLKNMKSKERILAWIERKGVDSRGPRNHLR